MITRLRQLMAGMVDGLLKLILPNQKKPEHIAGVTQPIAANTADGQQSPANVATEIPPDEAKSTHAAAVPHIIQKNKPTNSHVINVKRHAEIVQAIKNLDVLPAIPVIAQRLLALNLDTEEGERMLLVLIGQDPQISAKILGLANSAMVGASRKIQTLREATMLLGMKRVQSIATGIAIISIMAKAPEGEFNIHDLWQHSFRVAFAMQGIARMMPADMRPHEEQIFLAGMLHDIGFLVLAYIDPRLSDKLHNHLAAQPERPAEEVEREILEIGHDELGAELARHWSLPEEIIAVLRYHHNPDADGAAIGQPLVRIVNITEKLLPSLNFMEYVAPEISDEEWQALGISPSRAEEAKEQASMQAEQAEQFASSFA